MTEEVDEPSIVRLVNLILSQAINEGAASIHIDPRAGPSRVLYRVDGVLHEVMHPPRHVHSPCAAQLKIMANMDVAEERIPQYGKIHLTHNEIHFDLLVCSLPCAHGEKLVIKILCAEPKSVLAIEQLGMNPRLLTALQEILTVRRGLLLVSGPAGSGRSTTLYACLSHLSQSQRAICSLEDPIEHQIDNVNQIQVRPKIGLHFAQALRACQRSDADVIVVGELRDQECCRLAVDAACEGNLVVAGSFGNTAASSVQRLLDLDLEPDLLARALLGVLNQRLARRICPACKHLATAPNTYQLTHTWEGAGCVACRQSGNNGRTGLFELLRNTPELSQLLLKRASSEQFHDQACRDGMISLRQDALDKVQQGLISLAECLRIARED